MANRYWVGGTGNWDATTTHWSATSGGAGGQSVPGTGDDVFFDLHGNEATDAAYTVTINKASNCKNLDVSFTGTTKVTLTGLYTLNVYGNLNLSGGAAQITMAYTGTFTFQATSGTQTITSNGVMFSAATVQAGAGGTLQLLDTFNSTQGLFTTAAATLDLNNQNVNCLSMAATPSGSTLLMGTGLLTLNGTGDLFNIGTATNVTPSTSTVKITNVSASACNFGGGGHTYYNVWFARETSTVANVIKGTNTFNDIKDTGTVAHMLQFAAGTTQTVTTFSVSGTAGNLITIHTMYAGTGTHALVKTGGGIISSDYLNIQHSVASPANTWYAGANSTDNQAVDTDGSGWIFTPPPAIGPANLKSYNTNLKANVKSINTNLIANVKSLNTNV